MSRLFPTLALVSAFCSTPPEPKPPPAVTPCDIGRPPSPGRWGEATVLDGLGCWSEEDVRAIRDELSARRLWDGAVWSCLKGAD